MNKFYHFRQNNSGGSFDVNENLNVHVVVEARNAKQANILAQSLGIYFKGVSEGRDCDCCGDRWSPVCEFDGQNVPHLYGTPIDAASSYEQKRAVVHRLT